MLTISRFLVAPNLVPSRVLFCSITTTTMSSVAACVGKGGIRGGSGGGCCSILRGERKLLNVVTPALLRPRIANEKARDDADGSLMMDGCE